MRLLVSLVSLPFVRRSCSAVLLFQGARSSFLLLQILDLIGANKRRWLSMNKGLCCWVDSFVLSLNGKYPIDNPLSNVYCTRLLISL